MRAAHTGMNISEQEFLGVIDDALAPLEKHRVERKNGRKSSRSCIR
jgi:hypothetical protein